MAGLRSVGKLQLSPRLRHRPVKLKVAQVAVHASARANALYNFLAKVAALVKVERTQLRGLLGQVALHNIDAIGGNALSDAECLKRGATDRHGARGADAGPELGQAGARHPKDEVRRKHTVDALDGQIETVPLKPGALHGIREKRQAQPLENFGGLRAGDSDGRLSACAAGRLFAERHQLHIVHDDELVEVRQQLLELPCFNYQLQARLPGKGGAEHGIVLFSGVRIRRSSLGRLLLIVAPHGKVALDATLGVQHQVPCAGVWKQIVYGVGDHSAQPAKTVCAANVYAPQPAKVVNGGSMSERSYFGGGSVKLLWCEGAAICGKTSGRAGRLKHCRKRCGLYVNGKAGVSHRGSFPQSASEFACQFGHRLGAVPHPDYSLAVIALNTGRVSGPYPWVHRRSQESE